MVSLVHLGNVICCSSPCLVVNYLMHGVVLNQKHNDLYWSLAASPFSACELCLFFWRSILAIS